MKYLFCGNTGITSLNVSNNSKRIAGVDISKITIVNRVTIDANRIVSGYTEGTPIVYTYASGTSKKGHEILTVTLTFSKK